MKLRNVGNLFTYILEEKYSNTHERILHLKIIQKMEF